MFVHRHHLDQSDTRRSMPSAFVERSRVAERVLILSSGISIDHKKVSHPFTGRLRTETSSGPSPDGERIAMVLGDETGQILLIEPGATEQVRVITKTPIFVLTKLMWIDDDHLGGTASPANLEPGEARTFSSFAIADGSAETLFESDGVLYGAAKIHGGIAILGTEEITMLPTAGERHSVSLQEPAYALQTLLNGRVLRAGPSGVFAAAAGKLVELPPLPGSELYEVRGRVFLDRFGEYEVVGLEAAVEDVLSGKEVTVAQHPGDASDDVLIERIWDPRTVARIAQSRFEHGAEDETTLTRAAQALHWVDTWEEAQSLLQLVEAHGDAETSSTLSEVLSAWTSNTTGFMTRKDERKWIVKALKAAVKTCKAR